MGQARYLAFIGGFGLCFALHGVSLQAEIGSDGALTPAAGAGPKAEKSLLPEAARPKASDDKKQAEICQCGSESESASVEKIERALQEPLHSNGLDFVDAPLKDVIQQLMSDYSIPIQLDQAALQEVGVNGDQGVTINVGKVSLKSGLRLMLKTLQLTYIIQDEVLIITTPDAAQKNVKACVYNVSPIVHAGATDLQAIADMIQSCVDTDTWAINGGGQPEIRAIKPNLLVISQTAAVHEDIGDLLGAMRKISDQGGPSPVPATKSADTKHGDVVTRSYVLQMNPTNDSNSLTSQVRELIVNALPDEAWAGRLSDGQSVSLTVFHDRIVVRQTAAVQEKVEKILADSRIATPFLLPNAHGAPGAISAPGFGRYAPGQGMEPGGAAPPTVGTPLGVAQPGSGFGDEGREPESAAGFVPSPAPGPGE
jgi:hypothetical protein